MIDNLIDIIGHTPMVALQRVNPNPLANIWVKIEFLNPGLSIKDRIVKHIIEKAERDGLLKPGGTIIENTSGNTGAATAMIAAIKGYHAILTLPDKISLEKINSLKAFGAEVIICPTNVTSDDPRHYVNVAKALARKTPNSFRINQYDNQENPIAHYQSTGPEIWQQTEGKIDILVFAASTGGTISGVGRYIKERKPDVKVVMIDPKGSIYYDYFHHGKVPEHATCNYQLEGIGEDHLAHALDFSVVDDVLQVTDDQAFTMARNLAKQEGIFAGGSSGANVWGACELAKRCDQPTNIVTIIPDAGVKYLSKIWAEHS